MKKRFALLFALVFGVYYLNLGNAEQKEKRAEDVNYIVAEQCDGHSTLGQEANSSNQNVESIFLQNAYATYYYSNLTENYGHNEYGSCGYVAIGMLLSFWDTCWDDTIIPEYYESVTQMNNSNGDIDMESPGIISDDIDLVDNLTTSSEYYDVITQYADQYFHFNLIKMSNEEFNTYHFDLPITQAAGMGHQNYIDLLSHYLYTYRGYTTNQIEIKAFESTNSDEVKAYAIELIKQGIPVKIGVSRSSGSHAVIGYDYDEENDEIYAHVGWGSGQTHVSLSSLGYTVYNNVSAIMFKNSDHVCSNNYQYVAEDNTIETYCPCELNVYPTKRSITYANRSFQGRTATILVNNMYTSNPPSTYAWVSGLDLSNITARLSASSPYSPQMVFIGWCSDEALTQPITSIPQYSMGDITLYAKWRYDYNAVTATRDYVIIGDQKKFSYYDTATIGMGVEGLYEDLTAVGMEYLALTIHINIDNMGFGQKKIYFYGDETENSYLGEISFSFGDGVYTTTAYLPIETIKDIDILYLRYGGIGVTFNVWGTDQIFMEVMYVAAQSDATAVPFTWANQNPFN